VRDEGREAPGTRLGFVRTSAPGLRGHEETAARGGAGGGGAHPQRRSTRLPLCAQNRVTTSLMVPARMCPAPEAPPQPQQHSNAGLSSAVFHVCGTLVECARGTLAAVRLVWGGRTIVGEARRKWRPVVEHPALTALFARLPEARVERVDLVPVLENLLLRLWEAQPLWRLLKRAAPKAEP